MLRRLLRKTWVKVALLSFGMLGVLSFSGYLIFQWCFIPSVPEPEFAEPANQLEAYEQDLDYLETYADLEKSFEDETRRGAFLRYVAALRTQLDGMTSERFEVAVAEAVALSDNGHSNVSPLSISRRVNHFPIRTGPFEDGEFIIQVRQDYEHLLGAEIVSVEEHSIAEVTDSFVSLFGGTEDRSRFFSHVYINSPALLYGKGFTGSPDGATLGLKLANGETTDVYLRGTMLPKGQRSPYGREIMDYRVPEEDAGDWLHLMTGREPPLYLAEPDEPFLYRHLDDANGAYIKMPI